MDSKGERMSMDSLNRMRIRCDRCRREGPESCSAMEARVMALNEGWRFPPGLLASGRLGSNSDDVCPDCFKENPASAPRHPEAGHAYRSTRAES